MARFTKNVLWSQKPPPGYQAKNGLLIPDRLAAVFNENYTGVVYNYASRIGSQNTAAPASATYTVANTTPASGRWGQRLGYSSTSAVIDWGDASLFTPTTAVTIICGYQKRDATLRAATAFGINSNGALNRLSCDLPFSDGHVNWDWSSTTSGSGRTTYTGATFGDDIWAFTAGSRGTEIWQNGILRATSAFTGSRGSTSQTYVLGNGASGDAADLANWDFFYMWSTQIPQAWIQQITERPFRIFDGSYQTRIWAGFPASFVPITESISDSLSLSDSTSLLLGDRVALSDSLSLSDAVALATSISDLLLSDTLVLSDSTMSELGMIFTPDSFTLGDLLEYGLSLPISVDGDQFTFADAITYLIGVGIGKSDAFTFSDLLKVAADVTRTLGDNILLSDFLVYFLATFPSYSDSFALGDSAALRLSLELSQSDSLTLVDAVSLAIQNLLTLSASDSLNLSDSLEVTLNTDGDFDSYIRHYLNDVPR